MNPIFIDSYCLDLSKKNTKWNKNIDMHLWKIEIPKLCLIISGKPINPKIMKPIFIGLYCLDLSKKNTKSIKRSFMPLGNLEMPKLSLFNSGKSISPKFMKIYQLSKHVMFSLL